VDITVFKIEPVIPVPLIALAAAIGAVLGSAGCFCWRRANRATRRASELGEKLLAMGKESELLTKAEHDELVAAVEATMLSIEAANFESRFTGQRQDLIMGHISDAARGLARLLCVDEQQLLMRMCKEGEAAIAREIQKHGDSELLHWFNYVREQTASECKFPNGIRDKGHAGMRLSDFLEAPQARLAGLTLPHVLALRLYTSHAYVHLNAPLRDGARREARTAHPLAVTCAFVADGIKKLRAVHAEGDGALLNTVLYRGMQNVDRKELLADGGTEVALMSTTSKLSVAASYAASSSSVLFKLRVKNIMQQGADLQWLSVFPNEAEYLYPPLTFLQPTGITQDVTVGKATFLVVELEPYVT